MSRKSWFFVLLSSLAVLTIPACGGKDKGGASSTPRIVVKPGKTGLAGNNGGNGDATSKKEAVPAGFGSFSGRVVFSGTPPAMKLIDARKEKLCANNPDKVKEEYLKVDPATNGVANVFIYLQKKPRGVQVPAVPTDPKTFNQKFCTFTTHAMSVRVNQPISIVNSDNALHNTKISSSNSPLFDQGVKPNDKSGNVKYHFVDSEKVPAQVKCSIHTWMTAYILPLDHDFVAVSNEKGEFKIDHIPAGEHTFVVWHEAAGFLNRRLKITINADKQTEQEIKYGRDLLKTENENNSKTFYVSTKK